jgi:tetratricopeptide (TPR) repeat protein
LIAALAVLAHIGAFSAGWIWDDGDYITANRIVQSSDGWLTLWIPGATPQYYPLVFLGFWVEHAIVGNHPLLYHATNVAMHASSSVILMNILARLRVPHAAWIAALFAVHPMGVESVAWATERKNTQSLLLALASILYFIRAQQRDEETPPTAGQGSASAPNEARAALVLSFNLYLAALLSKTTAVFVAPALVLIALHRRMRMNGAFVKRVVPYFVVGAALGLFTAYLEKTHVGAKGGDFTLTAVDRLQIASLNILFYARSFALPLEQIFVYPRWAVDATRIDHWAAFAGMLLVAGACVWAWRITRAPLLILLWMCAALFPALGFIDVWPFRFSFVADHFAYAAMPALATVLVLAAHALMQWMGAGPRAKTAVLGAFVAVCVPLSWIAAQKYADVETLWRDTIARNPNAWLAHNNLASVLLEQAGAAVAAGDADGVRQLAAEALEHARAAYELKDDDVTHPANMSEALRLLGQHEESLVAISRAIEIAPHLSGLRVRRGIILEALARADDARTAYAEALVEDATPRMDREGQFEALRALRRLAVARGDYADAVRHARRIVELDPRSGDAMADLGALLTASGDADGGRTMLRSALTESAGFSSEQVMVGASVRYLRAVITTTPGPVDLELGRAIASRLASLAPGDPSVRYLALALEARAGDADARRGLAQLEQSARAANATQMADEIAALLASLPAAP